MYRYGGELNGIANAVVVISYPKEAFGNPKALKAFISTNAGLSALEILDTYTKCGRIKGKFTLDKYQIRSQKGIGRYWFIICVVCMQESIVPLKKDINIFKNKPRKNKLVIYTSS